MLVAFARRVSQCGQVLALAQFLEPYEERRLAGEQADQVPCLGAVFHRAFRNVRVRLARVPVEEPVAVEGGEGDGLAGSGEGEEEPGQGGGEADKSHRVV